MAMRMTAIDEHRKIKAIPQRYDGQLFRSKLEARWQVFFDTLSISAVYEIQGFDVDGVAYCPDFFLPEQWLWAEVKPAWDTDPGGVARWRSFVAGRGERGVLLTDLWPRPQDFTVVGSQRDGSYWEDDRARWLACPDSYHFDLFSLPPEGCKLCPRADYFWHEDQRIADAMNRARSYRFQQG